LQNQGVLCTYYNKPGHIKDKCWKLHGKPWSKDLEYKGGPPKRGGKASHVVISYVVVPENQGGIYSTQS